MTAPEPRDSNTLGLEESHVRRIGAILVLLDQRLDEMERWTSWPLPSGPLYQWRLDLGPDARALIRKKVAKARQDLFALAERLGLSPHVKVATHSIHTMTTFSLIDLEELEPRRLKAYGALSEPQEEILGALWEPLRESLEVVRRQCAPPSPEGVAP